MEIIVNLWEDLQSHFNFEGLVLFCPGKENNLADIASRHDATNVQECMEQELQRIGMDDVRAVREEVRWKCGKIDLRVEEEVLRTKKQRLSATKNDTVDASDGRKRGEKRKQC